MPRYQQGQLPPGLTTLQQYLSANAPAVGATSSRLVGDATSGLQGAKTAADQFATSIADPELEYQAEQAGGASSLQDLQAKYRDLANQPTDTPGAPSPYYNYGNTGVWGQTGSVDPSRLNAADAAQADTLQGNINTATNTYNNLTTPGGVQANLYSTFGGTNAQPAGVGQYTGGDAGLDAALVQGSGATAGIKSQDNTGYTSNAISKAPATPPAWPTQPAGRNSPFGSSDSGYGGATDTNPYGGRTRGERPLPEDDGSGGTTRSPRTPTATPATTTTPGAPPLGGAPTGPQGPDDQTPARRKRPTGGAAPFYSQFGG